MARKLDVVTQKLCKLSLLAICDLQQAAAAEFEGFLDQLVELTREYDEQIWSTSLLNDERKMLQLEASEQGRL